MKRAYYDNSVATFLAEDESHILGELTRQHAHTLEHFQRNAWISQIKHLKKALDGWEEGHVLFEHAIPRMGKRADVALLTGGIMYVLEYKVGADACHPHVLDTANDLKSATRAATTCPLFPCL